MSVMRKQKKAYLGRALSVTLAAAMCTSTVSAAGVMAKGSISRAYAADEELLPGVPQYEDANHPQDLAPKNASGIGKNVPEMDTTGQTSYWVGGNRFYALNQLNSGKDAGVLTPAGEKDDEDGDTRDVAADLTLNEVEGGVQGGIPVYTYKHVHGRGCYAMRYAKHVFVDGKCKDCQAEESKYGTAQGSPTSGGLSVANPNITAEDYVHQNDRIKEGIQGTEQPGIGCWKNPYSKIELICQRKNQRLSNENTADTNQLNYPDESGLTEKTETVEVDTLDDSVSPNPSYDFSKVYTTDNASNEGAWELIDTDAIWHDAYIYSTYGYQFSTGDNADNLTRRLKDSLTASEQALGADMAVPSIDELYKNHTQVSAITEELTKHASAQENIRGDLWTSSSWAVSPNNIPEDVNGTQTDYAFGINKNGNVIALDKTKQAAIAPVMFIHPENAVIAENVAKPEDVSASSALSKYAPGDNLRFLLKDTKLAPAFTTNVANCLANNLAPGKEYVIHYQNFVIQGVDNPAISAILYDESDRPVYYGTLLKADSNTTMEGDVKFTVPENLEPEKTYTLSVFEESLGGYQTYNVGTSLDNQVVVTGNETIDSYESSYQSGGVSYTRLVANDSNARLTVSPKEGAKLYTDRLYSKTEISRLFDIKNGDDTVKKFYVLRTDDYKEKLNNDDSYNNVTSGTVSGVINKVKTDKKAGTLPLTFIWYGENDEYKNAPRSVQTSIEVANDPYENGQEIDTTIWYEANEQGIHWFYKLNKDGDIIGLYTNDDDISSIIDSNGTLCVPERINGRIVTAVGGKDDAENPIPFLTSDKAVGWAGISFPATVKTITDKAFYKTQAGANIIIPDTITAIGQDAFSGSRITSVWIQKMSGVIGSEAFADTESLKSIRVDGGSYGLVVSSTAFRNTGARTAAITGNTTLNKSAFKNNKNMVQLTMSGNTHIGPYAFEGCTDLTSVYLPKGTTVENNAFNGCSEITKVETAADLPHQAFAECNKIDTLIIDEGVEKIEYDWDGNQGAYTGRKVFVLDPETKFTFGQDGSTILSPFASGTAPVKSVRVFYETGDLGTFADKTANATTLFSSKDYRDYLNGRGSSVNYVSGDEDKIIVVDENDGMTSVEDQMDNESVHPLSADEGKQTDIQAYYQYKDTKGVVLTGKTIEKSDFVVLPISGSSIMPNAEGSREEDKARLSNDQFYLVRNDKAARFKLLGSSKLATEEAAAKEKNVDSVAVTEEELKTGQETGSIPFLVLQYVHDDKDNVTKRFSYAVNVRIERYTPEKEAAYEYTNLSDILAQIKDLQDQVDAYKALVDSLLGNSTDTPDETIAALKERIRDLENTIKQLEALINNGYSDEDKKAAQDILDSKTVTEEERDKAKAKEDEAQKVLDDPIASDADKKAAQEIIDTANGATQEEKDAAQKLLDDAAADEKKREDAQKVLDDPNASEADKKAAQDILDGATDEEKQAAQERIDLIKKQIEQLQETINALSDLQRKIAQLNTERDELQAKINAIQAEIDAYEKETKDLDLGYTGTRTGADGTEQTVVYIDGDAIPYDKATGKVVEIVDEQGLKHQYTFYHTTGDIDHDGTDEEFDFVVTLGGLSVFKNAEFALGEDGLYHITNPDTAEELMFKSLPQALNDAKNALLAANKELDEAKKTLDDFITAFNQKGLTDEDGNPITIDPNDNATQGEKIGKVKKAVAELIDEYEKAKNGYAEVKEEYSALQEAIKTGDSSKVKDADPETQKGLKDAIDKLKDASDKADELQKSIEDQLKHNMGLSDDDKSTLQDLLDQVKKTKDELDKRNQELQILKDLEDRLGTGADTEALKAKIKELQDKAAKADELSTLQNQVADLQKQNDDLQDTLDDIKNGQKSSSSSGSGSGYSGGSSGGTSSGSGTSASGTSSKSTTASTASTAGSTLEKRVKALEDSAKTLQASNEDLSKKVASASTAASDAKKAAAAKNASTAATTASTASTTKDTSSSSTSVKKAEVSEVSSTGSSTQKATITYPVGNGTGYSNTASTTGSTGTGVTNTVYPQSFTDQPASTGESSDGGEKKGDTLDDEAAEPAAEAEEPQKSKVNVGGIILLLAILAAAVGGILFFLKKMNGGSGKSKDDDDDEDDDDDLIDDDIDGEMSDSNDDDESAVNDVGAPDESMDENPAEIGSGEPEDDTPDDPVDDDEEEF